MCGVGTDRMDRTLALWAGGTSWRSAWATALLLAALTMLLPAWTGMDAGFDGTVRDAVSGRPIGGAIITASGATVRTRKDGSFRIDAAGGDIGIRAYGYWRDQTRLPRSRGAPLDIALRPVRPRAVYLSSLGLKNGPLREALLGLHATTQVNALVIDVKDDRGALWTGDAGASMAKEAEGDSVAGADLSALIERLHRNGMYAIARIVVFKDDVLVQAHPEMALTARDGSVLRDNDGTGWTDPRNKAVWAYNIAVAVAAARMGFDEIQFDYVRFPSINVAALRSIAGSGTRREAIRRFLAGARAALLPYNVFIAVDVFGYASWDPSDTNIGQNLEDIAAKVDYVCLMLYPSSFRKGIPGSRMPLDNLEKVVDRSLRHARQRTRLPPIRFRPWLQAFPDYYFDHRPFGRAQITAQTQVADQFGSDGWMLWNAQSTYRADALP
jgi:hypothetical protein